MAEHVGKPFRQYALASAVLAVSWARSSAVAKDVPMPRDPGGSPCP